MTYRHTDTAFNSLGYFLIKIEKINVKPFFLLNPSGILFEQVLCPFTSSQKHKHVFIRNFEIRHRNMLRTGTVTALRGVQGMLRNKCYPPQTERNSAVYIISKEKINECLKNIERKQLYVFKSIFQVNYGSHVDLSF